MRVTVLRQKPNKIDNVILSLKKQCITSSERFSYHFLPVIKHNGKHWMYVCVKQKQTNYENVENGEIK